MLRIAIDAYLNANLGDDLFVAMLCRRYPAVQFYARGNQTGKAVQRGLTNLHYLVNDRFSPSLFFCRGVNFARRRLLGRSRSDWYVERCDKRVLIAGSCFMQQSGLDVIDWHEFFITSDTFVLGCNFGPFQDDWYLDRYRSILARAHSVCFRDKASQALFHRLKNVSWAPDIVFGCDRQLAKLPAEQGYLLVCPAPIAKDGRQDLQQYQADYLRFHIEVIQSAQSRGQQVILFSFCRQQDQLVIEKILAQLPNKAGIRQLHYPQVSRRQALGLVANAGMVLATRYHAMVLALLYERPVFAICYSEKTENAIRSLDCTVPRCQLQQLGQIMGEQTLQQAAQPYSATDRERIRIAAANAARQFSELDRALRSSTESGTEDAT